MYVFLQFVSTSVFLLSASWEFWTFRGMKTWEITTVTSIHQAYLMRTTFQTNALLQYKINKWNATSWIGLTEKEYFHISDGPKHFEVTWQNTKIEKHAGQHDDRGSQEAVKTTSCQRTQRRLKHLVLSLPLSLLTRSALWHPTSACLVDLGRTSHPRQLTTEWGTTSPGCTRAHSPAHKAFKGAERASWCCCKAAKV